MRVLLIDGKRDASRVTRILLGRLGYEVATASDAQAGLMLADQFAPDVVCVDVGAPGTSGYEPIRHIREKPHLKSSRVIAISGYPPDDGRTANSGIDGYLIKPASLSQLVMAMHN
ncbi:MAG TPA: response regulator [Pirellulales bacterium]|nr:response regulator [Pirellulales bacterium]